jgi:hypothetical protein
MLYRDPRAALLEPELDLWTPQAVIAALVNAYAVLAACTGRVGPARMRAMWPDFPPELEDMAAQAELPWTQRRTRPQLSRRDISHMEIALIGWKDAKGIQRPGWLNGPVNAYERPRRCLMASVMAKHHGVSEVELCRRMGWALATFKRQKLAAAGMIADMLNRAGIQAW